MNAEHQPGALDGVLAPRAIAIIGASDNPGKVGGKPLSYLKQFGYAGRIYPVNPARQSVQGLTCYPSVASLPEAPDVVIIAVAGELVHAAVQACADRGVRHAIVLSSGFGESGEDGLLQQRALAQTARRGGMRLIGPNAQGLANFSNGAVCNFSSMLAQVPPLDGPIAVISQSGATSGVLYSLLRERGLGVRYVMATGNESDVTVAELAHAVAGDPSVRLLLLYTESIRDASIWAAVAERARVNGIPILALKAGRCASGAAAAQSHTGALVNEDSVVDAFFDRHGIWRCMDPLGMADAAQLYLQARMRPGQDLVVISNSGSSCVMCADSADALGLPLAQLAPQTRRGIANTLAAFAACNNPIDLTAALMNDSGLLGTVLAHLARDPVGGFVLISLPVAGDGYDLERIASDVARFAAATGRVVAVASPLSNVIDACRRHAVPVFGSERQAMQALQQSACHARMLARTVATAPSLPSVRFPVETQEGFLNEAASLACLVEAGIPVVAHRVCLSEAQAIDAWQAIGPEVVLKACSAKLPHKSEHGLVFLGLRTESQVRDAFSVCREKVQGLGIEWEGAIVARMQHARRELAIGAKVDPVFGPVVMLGDGGKYIEAMPDFRLLMPPFGRHEARQALESLRIGPLFAGVRGESPMDIEALSLAVERLGLWMLSVRNVIASIDLNPVMVGSEGEGIWVADALVECLPSGQKITPAKDNMT